MKAFCIKTGNTINPFGDCVSETRIVDRLLADVQRDALKDAGVTLVDIVPQGEPYLLISDRTWFTSELIKKIITGDFGCLQVENADWLNATGALQTLNEKGVYEIAFLPPDAKPDFKRCPLIKLHLDVRPVDPDVLVNAVRHPVFETSEKQPFWIGTEMVFQIDHWIHILKVNHLSMSYALEKGKREFKSSSILSKMITITKILMKSRSINKWKIMQQLNDIEKGADIHPTAVVEFSTIKKGAKIGPFAVVRGCYIGEDAVIEQYAILQMSVVGKNAFLPASAIFNLCVAYPGAMISFGCGYQMSVFGYDCFMAFGVTVLDLSFGKSIKVSKNDNTGFTDSKTNFLGAVIGHRVRVGNNVRIGFGVSVPNDAFLVSQADTLLRDWNDAPVNDAVRVHNGKAVPVKDVA